jgi:hypothetical protein
MSKLSTIEEVDSSLTPVLDAVEPSPSDFIGPSAVVADETGSVLPLYQLSPVEESVRYDSWQEQQMVSSALL